MNKLLLTTCLVWLSTCGIRPAHGDDLAHFRINVRGNWEPVSLECEEGCAWRTLTFTLNAEGTLIDEFGMVGAEARADQPRLLIRVGSVGDRMALTCQTGCAWKALEFTLGPTPAVITERGKVQAVTDARAQSSLSPADIQLAIDIGRDASAAQRFLAKYRIVAYEPAFGAPTGTGPDETPTFGLFSTPFSRVVIASCEARQAGKPFSGDDVTAEMLKPELRVLAFRWNSRVSHPIWCVNMRPYALGQVEATSVPPVLHVTDVVILRTAEKGAASILPTRSERVRSRDLGLAEHIWYGGGVRATFLLADLPEHPILKLSISPSYGGRVERWGRNDGRFPIDLARLR